MIKLNSKKGITIISLVISIVVLLILSATAITSINSSDNIVDHGNVDTDIKLLKDKVLIYYNKYEEIPVTDRSIQKDGIDYYEIDLSKLEGITLKYGIEYGKNETLTTSSDVYVIDSNLNISYIREM